MRDAVRLTTLIMLLVNCCAMAVADTATREIDNQCLEDERAVEGWYVNDSRRGGSVSYLILQKKQQRDYGFYLCRLEGEARHFVRELAIEFEPAASRIEAARCTPVDSGVPGNEYFSVIDNRTSQLLNVYRFDAIEEDIERVSSSSVVCSALPAS